MLKKIVFEVKVKKGNVEKFMGLLEYAQTCLGAKVNEISNEEHEEVKPEKFYQAWCAEKADFITQKTGINSIGTQTNNYGKLVYTFPYITEVFEAGNEFEELRHSNLTDESTQA